MLRIFDVRFLSFSRLVCAAMGFGLAISFGSIASADSSIRIQFSHPQPTKEDYSIQERVGALLDLAVPGSVVRINIYLFNYIPVAQKIVDALDRGVDVKIVMDRQSGSGDVYDILSEGYGTKRGLNDRQACPDGKCLTVCSRILFVGACIGSRNNHNKFYLFERLADGRRNVVVQSTSNLTEGVSWNDIIEVDGNRGLFDTFLRYWETSQEKDRKSSYPHSYADAKVEVYFSPQKERDFYLELLARTDCREGGDIYIAHSRFTDERLEVAERLRALEREGCRIHALVTQNSGKGSPGDEVAEILGENLTVVGTSPTAMHTKAMLIHARFDSTLQKVVVTGSHNLNKNSRKNNDETLIVLKDSQLFDQYESHWHLMYRTLQNQ